MRRLLPLVLVLPAVLRGQATPLPPPQVGADGKPVVKKPAAAPVRATAPKEPVYPPLRPLEAPKIVTSQLPNGIKLSLVEDHELPLVQGYALAQAGSVFDPAGKEGLAQLTAELLRTGGTREKTAEAWDRELRRLGARVDVTFSDTVSGLAFTAPREQADGVLLAVRAMLSEPAFRLERLEVAKSIRRGGFLGSKEDARDAALQLFTQAVYGADSPYGREPSDASVSGLEPADVAAFYRHYYVPANVTLAIEGDFDPAAMQTAIGSALGAWHAQPGAPAVLPKAQAAAPGVYLGPAKNLTRVRFAVGQMGGELRDADAAAWQVLATVLGGTRRSRLLEQVHSPVPLDSLEIGADWVPKFDHPGLFVIQGFCAEPAFGAVLDGIQKEIARLRTNPPGDEEVRIARDAALARLVLALDTKAKRLGEEAASRMAGYPAGYVVRYQAALAAVTRADVERLAKTLDPARFTIAAIGDTEQLALQLQPLGRTVTRVMPPPAKAQPRTVTPDAAALERGRQLMARAQEASGGAEKVAALKDATRVAAFDMGPLAGGVQQVLTERWLAPNQFREDPAGMQYSVFTNGETGWAGDGVRSNGLGGPMLEQVRGELFKWYPRLLLGEAVPGRTIFAVTDGAVEIREGRQSQQVVFDAAGLPSEILHDTTGNDGLPITIEEVLEDFRLVGGVKMPFRVRILHNGQPAGVVTVRDLKVNSGLTVEDLMKRK